MGKGDSLPKIGRNFTWLYKEPPEEAMSSLLDVWVKLLRSGRMKDLVCYLSLGAPVMSNLRPTLNDEH
jgi:hypothetical protein